MTEEERRQKIRHERKMKRLRARRRKLIIQMVCVVLLIVLAVTGVVRCSANAKEKEKEEQRIEALEKKKKKEAAAKAKKKEQEDLRRKSLELDPENLPGGDTHVEEKIVYLTFDDGPSELTPKVLEILDKYNAKATFFVTNHDKNSAHYIKEAYDKGHTIGMHTSSHDYFHVYSSVEAYFADLDAIAQTVKEQIGFVPCFIRFPGGSSNTVSSFNPGIMTKLVEEVHKRGYQYYDWNAGCGDGAVRTTAKLIAAGTSTIDNNLLFLAHDSATKQTTVEALGTIIEHYQSLGYAFKAIDRETITAHHGVSN